MKVALVMEMEGDGGEQGSEELEGKRWGKAAMGVLKSACQDLTLSVMSSSCFKSQMPGHISEEPTG